MAIEVLRLPAVLQRIKLSRTSVYRLESENRFPKRINLGAGHAVGWYAHEIDDWLATRPRVNNALDKR